MRKTIFKVAALSVCLGLLLLTVPDVNAAQKKAPKTSVFTKAVLLINTVFPFKSIFSGSKLKKIKKVKVTGNLDSRKVSDSD